ncbi:UbiA-like polyprenyltransferase [Fictibacillus sp. Mic-4]|uniref:UbiA-like polyprenyltransferase n=1 Tax=Fictibacillus TaxID=1329200 RepID=UPI000422471A|nr:UbiA-like polyprenyltransferase [Fictibacillus gelatini]
MVKKLKIILEMIKFEHTLFALPFAYIGAILGSVVEEGTFPTLSEWVWITLAMVGARNIAMSLNRVIDEKIDQKNPRTSMRAIPAKLISKTEVYIFIALSFILLLVSCYMLNWLCVQLLPIAALFLIIYSFTKRFTFLCHIVLGITDGIAPLGGWVGATGTLSWPAFILFIGVTFWIAGFDVIYATQDAEFDKKRGLYSIPSYFGIPRALMISRCFHVITFIAYLSLGWITPELGWIYFIGVIVSGGLMIYEHSIISPNNLSKVNVAFFNMNGILSVAMFIFSLGDLLLWKFSQ